MNHLTEFLERLQQAERQYKVADSSLDSSPLEVIVAREELKQARFIWNKACSDYILEHVLKESLENVHELSNV